MLKVMRQLLVWLMMFGVFAGLSARLAAGSDRHVVITHSHAHEGDHHHHPHELPGEEHHDEDCPDAPHEHHHVFCCSPLVLGLERVDEGCRPGESGHHVALQRSNEAAPDGPYPELDTPPLI